VIIATLSSGAQQDLALPAQVQHGGLLPPISQDGNRPSKLTSGLIAVAWG